MWMMLIMFGLIPFALGGLMNWYMITCSASVPSFVLIGIVTLLIWAAIAYAARPVMGNTKKVVISMNLVAFVVLVLVGVQELLLQAYWDNLVGIWTQFYYLPLLNIGFKIMPWSRSVFGAYCAAFLLMVLAALLGCKLRKK